MRLDHQQETALQQLLAAELACAKEFKVVLDREFQALKGQDPELIKAISREKQSLMTQMQQYLDARSQLLTQWAMPPGCTTNGPKDGNQEIHQLLRENPASVCASLWGELIEWVHGLHKQNEINGGIIFMGQRHAKQALEILSGKAYEKNTYSRKGEQILGSSVHTLGKV